MKHISSNNFRILGLAGLVACAVGCATVENGSALPATTTGAATSTGAATGAGGGAAATGVTAIGEGATTATGTTGTAGGASVPSTTTGEMITFIEPVSNETAGITPSDKIDILFVVDNSVSMADKQEILKAAVPDLIAQLTNPACESDDGTVSIQPATAAEACPENDPQVKRPFEPVTDIHIAMVTSSLGAAGAAVNLGCTDGVAPGDDQARLVGSLDRGLDVATTGGFLAWDPTGAAGGITDQATLITSFQNLVDRVGETGCGFEAPLEAMYRFLIEPDPRAASTEPGVSPPVDDVILAQRAAFLRPDSVVAIILLTDENDCSFNPDNKGEWLFRQGSFWGGTTPCATNPNDPCCRACVDDNPNAACTPALPAEDPACQALGAPSYALPQGQDHLNVRCFEQKRRFGITVLHPVERYINGLSDERIFSRAGMDVLNPLYTPGPNGERRTPNKVFVVGLVGVPWQDVGTPDTIGSPGVLVLKTAKEMAEDGTWANILGDPLNNVAPADPLAQESIAPRAGASPVTGEALAPTDGTVWNSINGHERDITDGGDLQYACVFPLPAPRDCATDTGPPGACDCVEPDDGTLGYPGNPLCRDPATGTYSTVQHFAKAYPSPRVLRVLQGLTTKATAQRAAPSPVVASICPKNVIDSTTTDFGYRPVIGQLIAEAAAQLR